MDITEEKKQRCVVVCGAGIGDYGRVRSYLNDDDYVIYCDSGLRHMEGLGAAPSLVLGDWDSHENPHFDVETITLPVAKDDTDSVYAVREGIRRGFRDFLLVGAIGARLDHTLVNTYILTSLENRGCHGMIVDDYSEMELIASRGSEAGIAEISDAYPFFSLLAIEGGASGVTIIDAKFNIENASITADYQYATSNEPLPGRTASVSVKEGRLLLIKITE
jgi:thiamine pyrophosphokinase